MDRPYGISDFAFPSRWDRESGPDLVERAGQGSRADRGKSETGRGMGSNSTRSRSGFDRPGTIYRGRDREYALRESEVHTLTDLGKFRVVPEDDLARFGYQNFTGGGITFADLTVQALLDGCTVGLAQGGAVSNVPSPAPFANFNARTCPVPGPFDNLFFVNANFNVAADDGFTLPMSAEGFVGPATEPSTLILFAFGLMALGTFSWKLRTGRASRAPRLFTIR